jgi:carbon monoxide dehydrogenase subunit G
MYCHFKKGHVLLTALLTASIYLISSHCLATNSDCQKDTQNRLDKGEVVVELQEIGATKYVTGRVIINEPPAKVWPVMTNPFEFKQKICPHMTEVEVMLDKAKFSLLKITLDCTCLLPKITYLVESRYEHNSRIDFKRVGGILKDFKGSWQVDAVGGGSKTEVTYSMYVDTGFPVPQWLVREGIKVELPRTLKALRHRVDAICHASAIPVERSILAAEPTTAN